MAKRSRGSTRPGQRRPAQRSVPRPATSGTAAPTARPSTALTPEEEARAAELEARLVAEERAAEESRARTRDRSRVAPEAGPRGRTREGSLLAARAAEEYTYVVRDVRRIVEVGGGLMLVMLVLYLLIEVLHVL